VRETARAAAGERKSDARRAFLRQGASKRLYCEQHRRARSSEDAGRASAMEAAHEISGFFCSKHCRGAPNRDDLGQTYALSSGHTAPHHPLADRDPELQSKVLIS
jgi:hypothetical protein